MAPRITGSADRKKRQNSSSNRPVTQGQNPQRSNRQGVSQATVSNGDSRTRTGTARVTSGQEPPKPVTRQSRVNGRLVAGTDTRPSPNTRAAAKPAGPTPYQVSDPWAKPARASIGNVKGPASSPNRPAATPKPPAKPAGNFRAPALPKGAATTAANVVKGASKLKGVGRLLGPAALLGDLAATGNSVFNPNSQGNQQLARAMSAVNQRYAGKSGPRFKNSNGGSVASKGTKPTSPMPKGSGDALREKSYASLQKFDVPKPKAKPASLKAAASAPAYRGSSQGSTGSSMSRSTPKAASKPEIKQTGNKEKDMQTWRETAGKQKGSGGKTLAQNLDDRNARVAANSAPNYTQKSTGTYKPSEVVFDGSRMSDRLVGFKGADSAPKATSGMNAGAVRRAALTASADSVTEPKIAQTPNKKKKK